MLVRRGRSETVDKKICGGRALRVRRRSGLTKESELTKAVLECALHDDGQLSTKAPFSKNKNKKKDMFR